MKWIKKFEAKRIKRVPIEEMPEVDIKSDYLEKCQDIDDKSYITYDQFFNSLDFNMFSKHDYNKFYESGIGINHKVNDIRDISVQDGPYYVRMTEYGRFDPKLSNLTEWKKRNCFIYAEVNTGGASGGSCWDEGDDPGAQPYEGDTLDLHDFIYDYLKPILEQILNNYANEKSVQELCDILYKDPYHIIQEGDRSNYEYYGNYDNYAAYYITLVNLFIFLSQNDSF